VTTRLTTAASASRVDHGNAAIASELLKMRSQRSMCGPCSRWLIVGMDEMVRWVSSFSRGRTRPVR
jgi:hypothetical protein